MVGYLLIAPKTAVEQHLQHLLYLLYSARLRKKMESICSSSSRKCFRDWVQTGEKWVKHKETEDFLHCYCSVISPFTIKKIKDKRGNTSIHKLWYFHFGFRIHTIEQALPQSLSSHLTQYCSRCFISLTVAGLAKGYSQPEDRTQRQVTVPK